MAQLTIALGVSGQNAVLGAINGLGKGLSGLAGAPLKAVGSLTGAFGGLAQVAGGVVLGNALTQLPGQMIEMAKAAADDAAAQARLSQAITNLGGDFDAISGKVEEAIASGQKLAFTDDEIRDSFQALAAATGDADEALARQKAAMDLARGAGIPLAQATKLLGKLNEDNIEVFKRLGIVIGENATEADALAAVQKKFGGQAGVFADTDIGRLEQAKIAFSEIKEAIGTGLLPIVGAVSKALLDNLPAIQSWAESFAEGSAKVVGVLAGKLDPILGEIAAAVLTFRGALSGDWTGQTSAGISDLVKAFGNVGLAVADLIPKIQGSVNLIKGVFAGLAKGLDTGEVRLGLMQLLGLDLDEATKITEVITGVVEGIRTTLGQVADIVGTALGGDVAGAVTKFLDLFVDSRLTLVETLAGWAKALIDWIAPAVPGILAELQRTVAAVVGWAGDKGPEIGERLAGWGAALWAWVGPAIPPLLAELQRLGGVALGWVTEQAGALATQFQAQWLPAATKWAMEAAAALPGQLGDLIVAALGWVERAGPGLAKQFLAHFLPAAINWVAEAAVQIIPKFVEMYVGVSRWIVVEGVPMLVKAAMAFATWLQTEAIPAYNRATLALGKAIVEGIIEGIRNAGPGLIASMQRLATDALNAAKRALGISSPSRVFAEQVGVPIAEGIAAGIYARASAVHDSLRATLVAAVAEAETVLIGLADQIDAASDELDGMEKALKPFEKAFESARSEVERLKGAIGDLQSEMDNIGGGGILLPGEKETQEAIFGLKNAINILKHERDKLLRGGASKDDPAVKAIDAEIKRNQDELAFQEGKLKAEYDGQRHALEEAAKAGTEVTQTFEQQYARIVEIKALLAKLNAEELPAAQAAQEAARKELEGQKAAIEAQKTIVDALKEDYADLQRETKKWKEDLEKVAAEAKTIRDRLREAQSLKEKVGGAAGAGGEGSARAAGAAVTINNTIDARGMTPAELTQAAGQDLAALARTRITAGGL